MKIGFTERGDAGLDLSWVAKCKAGACDGVVAVTKNLTPACADAIMELYNDEFPIIVHATCTGWGGSVVEPNAPDYKSQLMAARALANLQFPLDNLVIRIDPIFPTESGLNRVLQVIAEAERLRLISKRPGVETARLRVSVLDEYPHVRERFKRLGHEPIYGGRFYAPEHMMRATARALATTGYRFETCAEPELIKHAPNTFVAKGCLSLTDLDIMGLEYDSNRMNNQNRSGCLCLGCKIELLTRRHPCPNDCQYCYWKD